jgi:hypothetical protein
MKIVITPEEGETFTEEVHEHVTDYVYAIRGKTDIGLPYAPRYGYKGEYAFLLGWLEFIKLTISREVSGGGS